ncbi:MAG: ATP-binding cassette domain-containing protein [Methanobacteriaceae archaeon]|jgi:cobalt/nickel transport system ATP-binding protein|uniref:ATP-binding cassette domain-containing protein n=1 Tax=unclassified Methanobrevibacter TaxID=2638681 RepID=UPI00375EBBFC|nr:ATP-binding cassette domain-containing protein [Methanobacteriaceae archaeon]MDD4593584.1 ATP-binding cassette domain-containing protein [Methanobacteriaceae archaeon]
MSEPILETQDLTFTYPDGTQALKNINMSINKGEKVAVMGANGAGKSTLFSHFNGLSQPTSGIVKINGEEMKYDKKSLLKIRQKVGVVFQNPDDQLFAPTVQEDVAFGPMNLGLDLNEVDKRVEKSLKMVGMEGFEEKPPHHLSGGQQKRVSIAGIIAMDPELMIIDEPTAGLDPQGVDQVLTILNHLNEKGMTLLVSSHNVELITEFANKIFIVHDGEIINEGSTNDVFSNHEILKKAHLRPPKASEILHKLQKEGLNVQPNKLTTQEACDEIIKAKLSNH